MSSFTKPLVVQKVGSHTWVLHTPFDYHVGSEESEEVITVPSGFETDFASVPKVFWGIFPPDGKYTGAAVIHDYLYAKRGDLPNKTYTREESDKIFLEAMTTLGVPSWKKRLMYRAVRAFGWVPWRKK